MQKLHKPQPEIGDTVLIDWPRTRWDGRQGRIHALHQDNALEGYGLVLLEGIAVPFPLERLVLKDCSESHGISGWLSARSGLG